MTKYLSLALVAATFAFTDSAEAFAPMSVRTPPTDIAEICRTPDGQMLAIQGFGETVGTVVVFSQDPKQKPVQKHGFTFRKEPGGVTRKTEVTFDIFELMTEQFDPGTTLRDRTAWSHTYEITFEGTVVVLDGMKEVGRGPMSCSAAMVEYR